MFNWLRYGHRGSQAKILENSKQTSYINLYEVLLVLLTFKTSYYEKFYK